MNSSNYLNLKILGTFGIFGALWGARARLLCTRLNFYMVIIIGADFLGAMGVNTPRENSSVAVGQLHTEEFGPKILI